jgi:hypothetical protein
LSPWVSTGGCADRLLDSIGRAEFASDGDDLVVRAKAAADMCAAGVVTSLGSVLLMFRDSSRIACGRLSSESNASRERADAESDTGDRVVGGGCCIASCSCRSDGRSPRCCLSGEPSDASR